MMIYTLISSKFISPRFFARVEVMPRKGFEPMYRLVIHSTTFSVARFASDGGMPERNYETASYR